MDRKGTRKMTAGEYGTPTHYLKGKDIKVPFDCLWHCYTRKFEVTGYNDLVNIKPREFDAW